MMLKDQEGINGGTRVPANKVVFAAARWEPHPGNGATLSNAALNRNEK